MSNLKYEVQLPLYHTYNNQHNSNFSNEMAKNCILFTKLFWPSVRKKCFSDQDKLLKFEAEGWEFAKVLEQLIFEQCKVRTILEAECFFNLFLEVSPIH